MVQFDLRIFFNWVGEKPAPSGCSLWVLGDYAQLHGDFQKPNIGDPYKPMGWFNQHLLGGSFQLVRG